VNSARSYQLIATFVFPFIVFILMSVLMRGYTAETIIFIIQITVKPIALVFLVVFLASSLNRRWNNLVTNWVLTNRRYLGISFALMQLSVGILLLMLYLSFPNSFKENTYGFQITFGLFGFIVIFLMLITSNDRMQQWIGMPAWVKLHSFGMYFVWASFFYAFTRRVITIAPGYGAFAVLFALAMVMKLSNNRRSRMLVSRERNN
jgi:methionine sulfoxide reductase heme-binding subunit